MNQLPDGTGYLLITMEPPRPGVTTDAVALDAAQRFMVALTKRQNTVPAERLLGGGYRVYASAGGLLFQFGDAERDLLIEFWPGGSVEIFGVQTDVPGEVETQRFDRLDEAFFEAFYELVRLG